MFENLFHFDNILLNLESITDWITDTFDRVNDVFTDIDFTILYSWLPADITVVISSIITVLLFLALIGLIRRILWFLG